VLTSESSPRSLHKAALIGAESVLSRETGVDIHTLWWRLYYFQKVAGRVRPLQPLSAWQTIPAGVAVLVPSGRSVEVDWSGGRQGRFWRILFDPASGFCSQRFFPQRTGVVSIRDVNGVIGRFCRRMTELLALSGPVGHGAQAAALMTRLLGILEHAEPLAPRVFGLPVGYIPPDTDAFANDVVAYMKEHLGKRLDRTALARHVHMSLSSLAHRYSEETGETLSQTLRRLRLAETRRLLLTEMPIDDITVTCGFSDRYHLSREFSRVEDMSPAAYRQARELMAGKAPVSRPAGAHRRDSHTEYLQTSVPTIVGRQSVARLDPQRRLNFNFWMLDHFHTPGVRVWVRGGPRAGARFAANTARLYRPNADYREESSRAQTPIRGAWVGFHPAPHWDLGRFFAGARHDAVFHDPAGVLGRGLEALNDTMDGLPEAERRLAIVPQLDALLDYLLRAVPGDQPGEYVLPKAPDRLTGHPVVERVRRFLQDNVNRLVRMSDIVKEAGVPAPMLLQVYRQWTGETPMMALHRFRILQAKRLLATGMAIKAAAEASGFSSPSHLSRQFKAAEGITPTAFVAAIHSR